MYDHTFNRGRKHFCRYRLQAFSTEEMVILMITLKLMVNK